MAMSTFLIILLVNSVRTQLSHRAPSKCVTETGTDCIFPFTYKETKYYECTFTDSTSPWCATLVDPAGAVVTNKWEDCQVRGSLERDITLSLSGVLLSCGGALLCHRRWTWSW